MSRYVGKRLTGLTTVDASGEDSFSELRREVTRYMEISDRDLLQRIAFYERYGGMVAWFSSEGDSAPEQGDAPVVRRRKVGRVLVDSDEEWSRAGSPVPTTVGPSEADAAVVESGCSSGVSSSCAGLTPKRPREGVPEEFVGDSRVEKRAKSS